MNINCNLNGVPSVFASMRTGKCFVESVALLALVALPLHCQAASNATSTPGCSVRATNYLGWTAEELSNPWVKLEIVPQIGGRLIQVTFGGHDLLYINPATQRAR